MDPITITQGACSAIFQDPMQALAWLRLLADQITPETYMALTKALAPENSDALSLAFNMIRACLGTPI